jgi:hypothetical protein
MEGAVMLFLFFVSTIAGTLYYRHKRAEMVHRERMTAMEKGVDFPIFEPNAASMDPIRRNLLFGLIWLFSGAGLAIFLFALSVTIPHSGTVSLAESQAKVEALRKLGASDDELRRIIYDQSRGGPSIPIGLATIGLIPMGVGLAYLVFYGVERKRYPAPALGS